MRWDAASFELGAPWHMTPDGVWHAERKCVGIRQRIAEHDRAVVG